MAERLRGPDGGFMTTVVDGHKICSHCNTAKPISEFNWQNKDKGYRQPKCRPCLREYQKGRRPRSDNPGPRLHGSNGSFVTIVVDGHKRCVRCGTVKPVSEFNWRNKTKGHRQSKCSPCQSEYQRERLAVPENREKSRARSRGWYAANTEQATAYMRMRNLFRKYRITPEEYQRRLAEQNGVCAICGGTGGMHHMRSPLVVDHDHETDEIRGLLCAGCNTGLGQFGDDPDRMMSAIAYLLSQTNVIGEVK